jgi:hypothetical protein
MKKENLEKAMMHCYRQLFAYSNPPADFDKLVENATINDLGQKVIPFMDHEIEESLFESIVDQTIKDFKIKPAYYSKGFRVSIMLGCSPKFKRDEKDRIA